MNKLLLLFLLLFTLVIRAQSSTEVFIADITTTNGKTELSNLKNISNNEGYDNQPSFYDDNTVIFASTRNGQTDIAKYSIENGETTWISNTIMGSEYSPLRIPESNAVSAVRLDTTGLQRLYKYNTTDGSSSVVLEGAKIGYHTWFTSNMLVATILVENRMDLISRNLNANGNYTTIQKNVGRALQNIPNSKLVSFISKKDGKNILNSVDPISGEVKLISPLPSKTQDMCWLADGGFLVPEGSNIYKLNPLKNNEQPAVINLSNFKEIHNISRMSISPNGKQIAIVSEEPPSKIVQKQVDSYNAGDLDAFVNCYAENVVVRNFPKDTLYVGHEKMRKNYSGLSPNKKVYEVEVVDRIVIGNKVIDREKVTGNGKEHMQVAIYEVNNGAISSMNFIFDDTSVENPEPIVVEQLVGYNARDIDKFLDTYTEDVQLFNFPAAPRSKGREEMRKGYAGFFASTTDLNCEIKTRIVIGNKVIDEEYITANGNNFSAVAIYEVENGKISKVTFL